MMVPEHIEVPQAVWEDETLLEGESFELVQAREDMQELVEVVFHQPPQSPVEHVLEPPVVVTEPLHWTDLQDLLPTPPPEPPVVEEIAPEEREYATY